jgi:hypothetical protein
VGGGVKMKKKIIFLLTLTFITSIINEYENKEISLKTNINTQHNTIVEFYKYIKFLTDTIPSDYIMEKNKEEIVNDLTKSTDKYTSKYSTIKFLPKNQYLVEGNTLLGRYIFTFNPETLHFVPIEGDSKKKRPSFICEISIYLSDSALTNQLPNCNYNQKIAFNIEFNNKIKESIILANINTIFFSFKKPPLEIPDIKNIEKNLSIPNLYVDQGDIIKNIKVIYLSENEHSISNLLTKQYNPSGAELDNFKKINRLINMKLKITFLTQIETKQIESCFVDVYQPWYYLLPDTLYTSVSSCHLEKDIN